MYLVMSDKIFHKSKKYWYPVCQHLFIFRVLSKEKLRQPLTHVHEIHHIYTFCAMRSITVGDDVMSSQCPRGQFQFISLGGKRETGFPWR